MSAVDLYCERVTLGLLGEPFNAATNAAMLIAAWFAWRYARASGRTATGIVFLIALMIAISFGSTLFHTFADATTRWLDVLPIAIFIAAYLWLYVRRVLGSSALIATLCMAIFILAAAVARQFPEILNGSIIYAPALVLVVGLGLIHLATKRREKGALIGAAAAFIAALGCRAVDNSLCAAFPVGTHFLWHLLTALSLYLAMRALIAGWSSSNAPEGFPRNGAIA